MTPIIQYIKDKLKDFYEQGELMSIIKIVLTEHFSFSTIELYGSKDRIFSAKEISELDDIIERLKKYEPIQYIIGYEYFCRLKFKVTSDVLIPRPETAELVDWICKESSSDVYKILDIGTGSGCIAISLASRLSSSQIEGWDISQGALDVASYNAQCNNVNVVFRNIDILKYEPEEKKYDVIVSNPPYITEPEKKEMHSNVLDWEPYTALFVNDKDPLLFYRRIALLGKQMLLPQGRVYFEINRSFAKQMYDMLNEYGYTSIEVRKDYFGNERMVRAVI